MAETNLEIRRHGTGLLVWSKECATNLNAAESKLFLEKLEQIARGKFDFNQTAQITRYLQIENFPSYFELTYIFHDGKLVHQIKLEVDHSATPPLIEGLKSAISHVFKA
jgi:hypothetical protein